MELSANDRGFLYLQCDGYTKKDKPVRLFMESSAIGDYEDSFARPGSSYLWVGDAHLNREEVAALVKNLEVWLYDDLRNIVGVKK